MLLHTDSLYDMGFHTQTAFTHRSFCTHKLLHAGAFARKCFSTQKTVYTDFLKQRYLYTELLLHTENSYIYRHAFLHTEAFTHGCLRTPMPLRAKPLNTGALARRGRYSFFLECPWSCGTPRIQRDGGDLLCAPRLGRWTLWLLSWSLGCEKDR